MAPGALRISWFNQPWLINRLSEGMNIAVAGKVEQYLGRLVLNSPDWEPIETEHLHTNRIVPIYPLTASIHSKMAAAVDGPGDQILVTAGGGPAAGIGKTGPPGCWGWAKPSSRRTFRIRKSRSMPGASGLAFDEIFYLQMGVLRQKRDWQPCWGGSSMCRMSG